VSNYTGIDILNTPPTAPTNVYPGDYDYNFTCSVNATWTSSTDIDGDSLTYYVFNCTDTLTYCDSQGTSAVNYSNINVGLMPNNTKFHTRVYAYDGENASTNGTAGGNPALVKHIGFIDENHTLNQYSMYTYQYNMTANYSTCIGSPTTKIERNSENVTALNLSTYLFSVTPPTYQNSGNAQVNKVTQWYMDLGAFSYAMGNDFSTFILPSGLMECGGSGGSSTVSLVYTVRDSETDALVNATYTMTTSAFPHTIDGTNTTFDVCINPTNETFNQTISEIFTATGYAMNSFSRNILVTNSSQALTVYMQNSTTGRQVNLRVIQAPSIPLPGAVIQVYRVMGATYTPIFSCTTDVSGACVATLTALTQNYFYNITYAGVTTGFGPEVINCLTTDPACYRTFILGNTYFPNCGLQNYQTAVCTYSNISGVLNCTAAYTACSATLGLRVQAVGNSSILCSETLAANNGSLNCTIPAVNATYAYIFYSQNDTTTYIISSGQITRGLPTTTNFGRDGWIVVLMIFLVCAFAAYFNVGVSMILGVAALGSAIVLGLVPVDSFTLVMVAVLIAVGALLYRMRM
jgi:hypothetical protein